MENELPSNHFLHPYYMIRHIEENYICENYELNLNGFGLRPLSRYVGYELNL